MQELHPGVPTLGMMLMVQGVILSLLGGLLLCGAPIQVMEGEELPVIVLGVVWGVVMLTTGPLTVVSGRMLRSYRGRWFALVMATVQLFVSGCFCGMLSLIIWIYAVFLLLVDRKAIASFYMPAF